jgi:hypothetical protein
MKTYLDRQDIELMEHRRVFFMVLDSYLVT